MARPLFWARTFSANLEDILIFFGQGIYPKVENIFLTQTINWEI